MKEKCSKFYLILNISTHTARKCVTIYINTTIESFYKTIRNIFQCRFFFIALISCSILSFKSTISLIFVLSTFVLMYSHRKISSDVKSGEHAAQEIVGLPLPIRFSLNFYVRTLWKNGTARHFAAKP